MGLEKQGARPTGKLGRFIGRLMNQFHTKKYRDYFHDKMPSDKSSILDIGCGGGKFIQFLANKNTSYHITGLDHSTEMVELSKKINQKFIEQKRVTIVQGSVLDIPLKDNSVDLVTAFETVHFWPDLQKAFTEIKRILKPGGSLLIINIYPKEGTKWYRLAQMKNDEEFRTELNDSGFKNIKTDLTFKKGWIVVNGMK